MSEMVDRVAKALWDLEQNAEFKPIMSNRLLFGKDGPISWEEINNPKYVKYVSGDFRDKARAAIAAMREPTPAMIMSVIEKVDLESVSVEREWEIMIDAALDEKP